MAIVIETYVICDNCGKRILGHSVSSYGRPHLLEAVKHAKENGWLLIRHGMKKTKKEMLCPECKEKEK